MRMTISALLATCLVLAFSISAWAQDSKYNGSLLWKISGKDITKPSYIFGTHHLTDISFLDKVNGFEESFESCNVVIGELDLSSKAELMQKIGQSAMMLQGEKGYKELLTEQEYAKLDADLLTHVGTPLTPLINMKPAVISILLVAKVYSKIYPNYNPQTHKAIDEHVQILAQEQNKTIKGLETVDDQIKVLFSDPIKEQLDQLICLLNEMDLSVEAITKLQELYESGNLNGMNKLDAELDGKSASSMKNEKKHAIQNNRNKQWLKQLPQLLKEDSNFVAVGALHLAGEEGLLFQLAKMGYNVEAVK